jgi:hypothetical protein
VALTPNPLPAASLPPPPSVGEATDLGEYGAVEFYDKGFDKLTARVEKPLERTQVGAGGGGAGGRGWSVRAGACCQHAAPAKARPAPRATPSHS